MFQFSEKHIEEFETLGYTVFKAIVPPTLITDLRRECDRAAAIVREEFGGQAQRFQPVEKFAIDHKPFQDYTDLPEIRDALSRVLSPSHQPAGIDLLGVLINPTEVSWCTQWHRDWRDNIAALDVAAWAKVRDDRDLFNQVNCALYEDSCTWVVPASHNREDTDAEARRFPTRPIPAPELEGLSNEQRERVCLEYCESLPGAQRLLLDAGDYCVYRNTLWHLGNYIPYRKRATLHDAPMTPAFSKWCDEQMASLPVRKAAGITWENPNAQRLAA